MKKIASFFLAATLITGGIIGYQQQHIKNIEGSIGESLQEIEDFYAELMEDAVLPLQQEERTDAEAFLLKRAIESFSKLEEATGIGERVERISMIQQSLSQLAEDMKEEEETSSLTEKMIKHEVSDKSTVRPLLQHYNNLALQWNTSVQGKIGSLLSSMSSKDYPTMPLLRFDGEQEYANVIQL